MREILFRAKCKETGDWEYGFLGRCDDEYVIEDMDGAGSFVDPETVGQFTGLIDKNGTKIFEGDIIKRTFEHIGTQYAEIGWAEKYASFKISPFKDWQYTNIKDCEKVGNIYDNPEYWKKRQSGKVIHDNGKFVAVEITK